MRWWCWDRQSLCTLHFLLVLFHGQWVVSGPVRVVIVVVGMSGDTPIIRFVDYLISEEIAVCIVPMTLLILGFRYFKHPTLLGVGRPGSSPSRSLMLFTVFMLGVRYGAHGGPLFVFC